MSTPIEYYATGKRKTAIARVRLRAGTGEVHLNDKALDDYFGGRRTAFDLALDMRGLPEFTLRVLSELAKVPYGQTATYGELAERVGNPRASRAVGTVMNRNRIPIVLPCHRIVGSSGDLVGYGGGLERKERLLRLEGAML